MTILITGGASGLGEAITKNLAKNTANRIFFTYCKSEEKTKKIESEFPNTKGIYCDFNNSASIDSVLTAMEEMNPGVLINNALTGIQKEYFHKTDPDYFVSNFTRNVLPVIKITQKAILLFRKQKSGKIITIISSYVADKPLIGLSEYIAEKNYLLSLSKSWAAENAKFNITSNAISPSFMLTGLTSDTDERIVEEMISNHPAKKLLTTDEVAEAVNFILNAAQEVNGINLVVNSASDISPENL